MTTKEKKGSKSDASILELLLTYSIGRKDVKPLVNTLLEQYGDLSTVLSANAKDLAKIKGIGESSAVLLKIVDFIRRNNKMSSPIYRDQVNQSINQLQLFNHESQNARVDTHFKPQISSNYNGNRQQLNRSGEKLREPNGKYQSIDETAPTVLCDKSQKRESRKLQVSNGYCLEFDQLARVLNFLFENKKKKKIPRAVLTENTGLSDRQVAGLVSIGSAMGLIKGGVQILTPVGLIIAENDIFLENRTTLEWCHYMGAGSYRNLIWYEMFNNVLKKRNLMLQKELTEYFKTALAADYTPGTIKKNLSQEVRFIIDGDPEYGILGYNGGLFDDEQEKFLARHQLRNDFLARALYLLAYVEPLDNTKQKDEYPIPYEDLEVRHLGELYENILEYTVQLADADRIRRRTKKGVELLLTSQTSTQAGDRMIKKGDIFFGESALERKQTGSYYTPESLVKFINEKTIIKPLSQCFKQKHKKRFEQFIDQAHNAHDPNARRGASQSAAALVENFVKEELLNFKVCDPAMGSGHFLVDAANQMSGFAVSLLEEIPYIEGIEVSVPSDPNYFRRLVTRHCLYGVDLNPLAVNLAKLSLWLNCFAVDHKLTFLDHHLKQGNSLMGIRSLKKLDEIPKRKKDGKKKEESGLLFDYNNLSDVLAKACDKIVQISRIDEDETDRQKEIEPKCGRKSMPMWRTFTAFAVMISPISSTPFQYSRKRRKKPLASLCQSESVWRNMTESKRFFSTMA